MKWRSGFGLLICWMLASSCGVYNASRNTNLSHLYDKDQAYLHPQYVMLNVSESNTRVYVRIAGSELLAVKSPGEKFSSVKYSLSFLLKNGYEDAAPVDSVTYTFSVTDSLLPPFLYATATLKSPKGKSYLLQTRIQDLNRNQGVSNFFTLDRSKTFSPNDMAIAYVGDTLPLFDRVPDTLPDFRIIKGYETAGKDFIVDVFRKDFPLPIPPFAMIEPAALDVKSDSTFIIPANQTDTIRLKQSGVYWFRTQVSQDGGFALTRFYNGYPNLTNVDQMIPPLRYLSSKSEYKAITDAPNKREAMENFWLECAGSQNKARELIKSYYNRVKDANRYFASYLEGWKTDRGLVYIIFGPPNIVYRNNSSEQWIYGSESSMLSLNITFTKMENPFTDNDYSLIRNGNYKNTWYQAVDSWRQGRVWLE